MKVFAAILLIVLLILVALPVGMGHMGDCPACTPARGPFELALCAALLSLAVLIVRLMIESHLRFASERPPRALFASSVYRPPRFL
jgi:hypothetical protein